MASYVYPSNYDSDSARLDLKADATFELYLTRNGYSTGDILKESQKYIGRWCYDGNNVALTNMEENHDMTRPRFGMDGMSHSKHST